MAKNIIPNIAEMLGVEIGEEFEIEGLDGRYKFNEDSLRMGLLSGGWASASDAPLYWLCGGKYTIKKLPFKPKKGEKYFCFGADGKVLSENWESDGIDAARYLMGNCFRTREEAKAHRPEIMAKFKEVLG